jgi:hypothetical protein
MQSTLRDAERPLIPLGVKTLQAIAPPEQVDIQRKENKFPFFCISHNLIVTLT